jgi:uncharacterized protein
VYLDRAEGPCCGYNSIDGCHGTRKLAMKRDQAIKRLAEILPTAQARYAVQALYVFGSVARDEATDDSDVDILVDFAGPPTFLGYMGLKVYLEDTLGVKVDLATRQALRPRMRPRIEAEALRVA